MGKLISKDSLPRGAAGRNAGIRDRRFTIRYPFAADAELFDLEPGSTASGIPSDISLSGCFVCASRQLRAGARARLTLHRKGEPMECLVVVRVVKPKIGMGVEFLGLPPNSLATFERWIASLRRKP